MDSRMGDNLCGPSVIEVPEWCVFKHSDGKFYLFYCGAGESAIGIAELVVFASDR
jgi:hypothetical protein